MARTLEVRIVLRANQFKSGLTGAATAMNKFGVQVSQQTANAAQGAKALGLASAVAGKLIVLGIGGAMAVSTKAAIDFESSLTSVAKTTDLAGSAFGDATEPLAVFGQAIRNLALRTPVNVNDLNEIAALGGQLGISTPNLIEFTDTVAKLGVATNLGIQEAATGLARFVNIMGSSEEDFDKIGSIIVELGNNFATTESEILHFALRIAPVGKAVGATEDEMLGLSAALSSLGIPAERGGTAVQRLFIDMASAIDAGGDKLQKFGDVAGMSGEEFAKLFGEAPSQAFVAFVKGLDRINESGQSVFGTLRELGIIEQRSIQVLLASAAGWETVADAVDTAAQEAEEVNALNEESARRFGTTASQIQLLGNAFRDLQIEIGGAILGSGGITNAIDVLREFFTILKDNKDTIGNIVLALSILAGLRLGMGLAGLATKAMDLATQFKSLATTASISKTAVAGVGLASAITNVAIGALALGVGILVAAWVNAAIKAAELTARTRALNEAIEEGADPVEALVNSFYDANILTEDRREMLQKLNIGEGNFVETVLAGRDAVDLLNASQREQLRIAQEVIGGTEGARSRARFTDEQLQLLEFTDLVKEAEVEVNGLMRRRKNDLVKVLYDSGVAAGKTRDQLLSLAEEGMRVLGFGVSTEEFSEWASALQHAGEGVDKSVRGVLRHLNDTVSQETGDFVLALTTAGPEGEQAIDTFFEDVAGSLEDGQELLDEEFKQIRDTILKGFPQDADYEQMKALTEKGLQKILDAQMRYIDDLNSWNAALSTVRSSISQDTLDWLNNQTPQMQGALGRLFEQDPAKFNDFITGLQGNFDTLQTTIAERWGTDFPQVAEQGFGIFLTGLMASARKQEDDFNLVGADVADMVTQGLALQLSALDDEQRADYLAFLTSIFGSPEQAKAMGFDLADPIVQGIIAALGTLSRRASPVIQDQVHRVGDKFNSSAAVTSPSKMTYYTGEMMGEGLWHGIKDSLSGIDPIDMRLSSTRARELPPITVVGGSGNGGSSYTRATNVTINNPHTNNLREDVQLISIYGGLAESVEGVRV